METLMPVKLRLYGRKVPVIWAHSYRGEAEIPVTQRYRGYQLWNNNLESSIKKAELHVSKQTWDKNLSC